MKPMLRACWIGILTGLVLTSHTQAATTVGGSVEGTWTVANSPYLVTSDAIVGTGRTLTIQPGVTVQFQDPDDALVVYGTLTAVGTAAAPIQFTSDDTAKAPGQWEAIIFLPNAANPNSLLEYCVIECGGAGGAEENVRCEGASPTLRHCTIRRSRLHGARLLAADPVISDCEFTDNGAGTTTAYAVMMRGDSLPKLSGNRASGNPHNAIAIFGGVSRSGTWTRDNLPYTLIEDVWIWGERTLTIEAGTVVQFQDADDALLVDGALVAKGTLNSPIQFTSDEAAKSPGQWESIQFRSSSISTNSLLEHCVIEGGGGGGAEENLRIQSASPTVRNCIVRQSRLHGARLFTADPIIDQCQFLGNGAPGSGAYPLMMSADSLPDLRGNAASGSPHNAIGVFGGNFSRTGTWHRDGMPYTLVDDLLVWRDRILTLEPGVVVQFQDPDDALIIDGTLVAAGTAERPIRFTSDEDIKAPGQWDAIIFRDTSVDGQNILDHCLVEYGGAAGRSEENVRLENASPTFRNSTFSDSRVHGLKMWGAGSNPVIEACTFTRNGVAGTAAYAIMMQADALPRLAGNTATNNVANAIGVYGGSFTRSGTWVRDRIPYTIVQDLVIPSGQTLTIEPGTTIQFQDPDDALVVDGALVAQGTALLPIRFTSDDPVKAPGQWEAIIFHDSTDDARTILEYCLLEYGGAGGAEELLRCESASPTIRHCTFRHSRLHGAKLLLSDARIDQCQFLDNGHTNTTAFAIAMRTDSLPRLAGNLASGNTHDAIAVFGGNVSRTGTWPRDGMPYTLVEDTFIWNGQSLTLDPGVIVQFQDPDDALVVDGALIAVGTAALPIVFTSDDPVKAPGQWEAIIFRDRSDDLKSILERCIVECGGAGGAEENLRFESASPTIRNSVIRQSRFHGVKLLVSDPRIEQCQFVDNGHTNAAAYAIAMRADSLPVLLGNRASGNPHNATAIFGSNVNRSGTWTRDDIPYTLTDDTYVWSGRTLTIAPGTIVQFQDPDDSLLIDGALVARGTDALPIRFTSDDAVKAPGQWESIVFRDSSDDASTILERCLIEYGGRSAEGMVAFLAASPTVQRCQISSSISDGIDCSGSSPAITSCRITGNGRDGVRTSNRSTPRISQSTLATNAEFGIRNLDPAVVVPARQNYWGHPTGPLDNANTDGLNLLNPTGQGQKVTEYVDWSGFLSTDPVGPTLPADIEVDPSRVDFGSVTVGQTKSVTVTVHNRGGSSLLVTRAATATPQFIVQATLPLTVPASGQATLTVQFQPSTAAAFTDTLTVSSDDPDEPTVTVALTGTGSGGGNTAEDGAWNQTEVVLRNTPEADLMVRTGDIDFLNFGFPAGFDPFSGQPPPSHGYPWAINPSDPAGTDRIMVPTSYVGTPPVGQDGYTASTQRPDNNVQTIVLNYALNGLPVTAARLQIFIDDLQASLWGARYTVELNGVRAPFIESVLNAIVVSGATGRLVTLDFPAEFLTLLNTGTLTIRIDDLTTGAGDGFAIDFVKLLINPHGILHAGRLQGKVTDVDTGSPLAGASITASGAASATTDANGDWNIPAVPAGLVAVECSKAGYGTLTRSSEVVTNQTVTLNFALVRSAQPDVSVTLRDAPDPVQLGELLTYAGTVTNAGPIAATGVVASHILPAATLVTFSTSQGTATHDGGVLTWLIGTIQPGATASLSVTVRTTAAGTLQSEIEVTAATIDPNPANNTASTVTQVVTEQPGCASVPGGLMAWWRAEGNGDDAYGGNDGTLQKGVTFTAGQVGQAFQFDGVDDYVETAVDVQPAVVPETTWEAWVFPTRIPYWARQQILSNDDGGYDRSLLIEGNKFTVFTGAGVWPTAIAVTNEWQHVAVVFTPDNVRFYRNGEEFVLGAKPVGQATGQRLRIASNPCCGEFFQGAIDEVSIYSRALSATEIQAIYQAGAGGKCTSTPGDQLELRIERTATGAEISWSATPTGWNLQSTPHLSPPIPWADHPAAPVLVNGRWVVRVATSQAATFYRLIHR